jgi:transposase-like protein
VPLSRDGRNIYQVGRDAKAPTVIMPVNNPLERIIREIRRRTRVVGAFPDGHSALVLTAVRLRHVASTKWGRRRYLPMDALPNPAKQEAAA